MPKRWTSKFYSILFISTLTFALTQPTSAFAETGSKSDGPETDDEKLAEIEKLIEDQESLLEEKTPDVDDELQTMEADDEDEDVSVIVQMSESPVTLAKASQKVRGGPFNIMQEDVVKQKVDTQHDNLLNELEENEIEFKELKKYDYVLNGMALTVKASDVDDLAQMEGVVSVDRDEERYALDDNNADDIDEMNDPEGVGDADETDNADDVGQPGDVGPHMDVSIPHLDVPDLWDDDIKGEGVEVAVLDTGIDYKHPDLEDVYAGGYNFVSYDDELYTEERDDDDPYETTPEERPEGVPEVNEDGSEFNTSHGTHVAGTIAAQGNNDYGIEGVAPDVDLYAYRVLGAYGTGESSGIIEAIDKAAEEGMDVINLSLGGGGNDQTAPDAVAINNAALDGVTPVISTGNSGPGRETIGNPSASAYGISVGNSTLPEPTFNAHLDVEAGDFDDDYESALMAWEYGNDPDEALSGEYDVVPVPGPGEESDYDGLDVDGNVALVSRGDIAFVDKIAAAENEGAAGIIVHNNEEGEGPADELLGQSFDFIPTFDISLEDGEALREAIDESDDDVGTIDFSGYEKGESEGDGVDDTSSQGPTMPTFDVKPDVVAPGTNIMSSVPAYGKEDDDADYEHAFDSKSGTSMAAPHIAGTAALILSEHDDWGPSDVKVAMSNTAKQLDTDAYDVFTQGPGRVQPSEAANPEALAYVQDETTYPEAPDDSDNDEEVTEDYEKGAVTFGRISPDEDEETTVTRDIKVEDLVGEASDYEVDVEVTQEASGELADADVEVDKDAFTLDGEETLEATLTVPEGEEEEGNEILGYIYLESDTNKITLPFAAEFSTYIPTGLEYYFMEDEVISPNDDDVLDETELNFSLHDEQQNVIFELWSAEDPGPAGDHYIGFLDGGTVPAGQYTLPIDGTYMDLMTGTEEDMDDGVYSIDFNKPEEGETMAEAPLIVKTEEPEVEFDDVPDEIDESDYTVSGTIDDELIDFKETYEESFEEEEFDVEEYLSAEYELTDSDDEVVDDGEAELDQEGAFDVGLSELETGDYSLNVDVDDSVGNSTQDGIDLHVEGPPVSLTPSTTDYTTEPVTIDVEVADDDLVELKWLEGDESAEDVADDGEDILESKEFEVEENDTYTVYAKNEEDLETLETIDIDNITEPIEIDLTPSTEDYTDEPVTIDISTDSPVDLEKLKWLPDEKEASDFDDAGNDILATGEFEATKNRMYTIYAQNEYGIEAVETIEIEKITEPVEISLEPSTEDPTDEPVEVDAEVESIVDVTDLKWLPGKDKSAEDFEENGTDMLDEEAFEVDENGMYSVFAKNSEGIDTIEQIYINNIDNELSIHPSTEDPTDGAVSITVDSEHLSELTELQWLQGDLDKEDFADGDGEDIDLEDPVFEVDENDMYTVYAKNDDDIETVNHVSVDNIVQPVTLELSESPTDPANDPVTIDVEAESDAEVKALRWLKGDKSTEDFEERKGHAIDPETDAFSVEENGTYTVYAISSEGYETTEVIEVDNIGPKEEDVSSNPAVEDGQASIPDEDIAKLADEGTLSVDLEDAHDVTVEFSDEQVKRLREKDASLTIYNDDVEMTVPMENLPKNSDVAFNVEKSDDDVDEAVSKIYDLTIYAEDDEVDKFTPPVELTFQIDMDKVDDTDNLDVYYFDENKEDWVRDSNMEVDDGEGQIGVDHFTKFAVLEKTDDKEEEEEEDKDDEGDNNDKGEDEACDCDNDDNDDEGSGKNDDNGDNSKTGGKKDGHVQSGLHQGDKSARGTKDDDEGKLPQTATPMYNYLLIGAAMLLAGFIVLFIHRRKNKKETI